MSLRNTKWPETLINRGIMAEYSGMPRSSTALTGAMERLAARRIAQAALTLDTETVARRLAVCRTRVQRLLEDGALYAYATDAVTATGRYFRDDQLMAVALDSARAISARA